MYHKVDLDNLLRLTMSGDNRTILLRLSVCLRVFSLSRCLSPERLLFLPQVDGGMPAIKGAASMVGTSQSTASSGQPSAQTACKLDEPPSATEAQLLSVRVDSLQTQHKMLEQQVSTLLQGRKPDGSGKCTTSADIVGDRMSSGFIRPRNRSKDGTPFLSSSLRVQQPGHSFGHLVCRKDGEGRFPGCPCVGHAESPTCPHGRQVKCKEVSVEQLSQMCSVTAEPVTPVDETSPAVKESTSGALSFDLVESMRHLVLKGNRNQSKMLSMLQALQESMAGSGQEKIGSISPAERIQESGSTRVKRKRNGRQSCDDAKDSQDQVEVKKRSKEKRRRRREQDSRYGKHHIAPASVPNTTAQMPNVDESASVREVGELNSSIEAGPQYRCVGVEGCEAMSASRCNEFVKSEGKAQYQLRTEEGVVDLALERGGTAVVVSPWELSFGCDDELWADWLAGKLELLSPSLPSISIPQDGEKTEERCSVAVGATGTGDDIGTAREVPLIAEQSAGENHHDMLTCSDDGGEPVVLQSEAAALLEKHMVVEESKIIHSNISAEGQSIADKLHAGEDAVKQPGAEGTPD